MKYTFYSSIYEEYPELRLSQLICDPEYGAPKIKIVSFSLSKTELLEEH